MGALDRLFSFSKNIVTDADELPEIFPMPVVLRDFIYTDVITIFSKILTDVLERTQGLQDDQFALMWDSCLKSSKSDGLITMLAKAMAYKKDLYLVYDRGVNLVREATDIEQTKIKAGYDEKATSDSGVFISFDSYRRSDMIRLYSALEYYTVASLYKSMNASKALQLKFKDLRGSVSLADSSIAKAQAQTIAKALGAGRDVMLDAEDSIETSTTDLTPVKESISFIANKMSFYLGLPASYITGEQTGGIGSTGESDTKAIERGLKNYFYSVMKPVLEALFDVKVNYKSQDFRQITSALEALKTFALVGGEFLSADNKTKIINALLDLPDDAEGDEEAAPVLPAPAPKEVVVNE